MAALGSSRNTPEWNGAPRFHWGAVPVEAATSLYLGGMVALNANGRAVPAQARGTAPLDNLRIIGICEYVYSGGILPPGVDALNQTGNGGLYPGATATVGTAGAISVGVVCGIFGMDVDSSITDTSHVGQLLFAVDDHTLGMGTAVANSTSITVPGSAPLINILQPDIVPGSFNACSATGGGGTRYKEGVDFAVDYQAGTVHCIVGRRNRRRRHSLRQLSSRRHSGGRRQDGRLRRRPRLRLVPGARTGSVNSRVCCLPLARSVAGEGRVRVLLMPQGSKWTVIVGALLTMVPQMIAIVPAEYRDVASGLLAAAVAAWHLYQPSPAQGK